MSAASRGDEGTPRAVGRVSEARRLDKARLAQQLSLARSVVDETVGTTASGVVPRALHVGIEDARFAPLAADRKVSWRAVAPDEQTAKEIRSEVVLDYEVLAASESGSATVPCEKETAHLSLTIDTFAGRVYPDRRALFAELYRVTRVGGAVAVVDTFVARPGSSERPTDPLPMSGFLELAFSASGGQLMVERLRSVRYPGEVLRRGALVVFSKLGAPTRW